MPSPPAGQPLSALLGRAHARFVGECERRLAEAGFPDLRIAHGANVLRHLHPERPVSTATLPRLSGVSKQAVSQQVRLLADHGYVRVSAGAEDARTRDLVLTGRGVEGLAVIHRTFGDVEREWRTRYGPAPLDTLRASLEALMEESDRD